MAKKSLLSSDEIKRLPKGEWIYHNSTPFKAKIDLFTQYNIIFDVPYTQIQRENRKINHVNINELFFEVEKKFKPSTIKTTVDFSDLLGADPPEETDNTSKKIKQIASDYLKL